MCAALELKRLGARQGTPVDPLVGGDLCSNRCRPTSVLHRAAEQIAIHVDRNELISTSET